MDTTSSIVDSFYQSIVRNFWLLIQSNDVIWKLLLNFRMLAKKWQELPPVSESNARYGFGGETNCGNCTFRSTQHNLGDSPLYFNAL